MPYGGTYELNRPDLGLVGKGTTWEMVRNRIMDYRKANGIPIGLGFDDELEQAICRQYPAECEFVDGTRPRMRSLGLGDIVTGTRVMLSLKLSGSPLVDRPEAERRAKICQDCVWNQTFSKPCGGICQELLDIVKSIVGSQGTQYDMNLKSCNICACLLQAAIWVPLNIQVPPLSEDQKAQFESVPACWKKQSLMT